MFEMNPKSVEDQRFSNWLRKHVSRVRYNSDTADAKLADLERRNALEIKKVLEDNYPNNHFWVRIDLKPTCMYALIGIEMFHKDSQGKMINMREALVNPNMLRDSILRAGGELLERFGLRRGKANADEWREKRHPFGQFMDIPD